MWQWSNPGVASIMLFIFLKSVIEMCVVCFCFWVGVQSVSGSFCMHISGIVSYDCKNESSSHQLKYFIFTDRAVLWLSLRVISDVSHSVTLLSSMKNISRFFSFFSSWKLHPRYWTWKRATCSITLSDFLTAWLQVSTLPFTGQFVTKGFLSFFYLLPTLTAKLWPHKDARSPT